MAPREGCSFELDFPLATDVLRGLLRHVFIGRRGHCRLWTTWEDGWHLDACHDEKHVERLAENWATEMGAVIRGLELAVEGAL
jgi:hypothetical protein